MSESMIERVAKAICQRERAAIEGEHTFFGEKADQGRIVVGHQYSNEGYAVVRCGNTEVQIGYSLLHNLSLRVDKDSANFADLCQLQKALHSITCEASQGRKGD